MYCMRGVVVMRWYFMSFWSLDRFHQVVNIFSFHLKHDKNKVKIICLMLTLLFL